MNIWYEDTLKKWLTKICFFVNETDFQRNTLSFKETKILIIKQLLNPLKFIETHWRVPDGVQKTVTSVIVFFLFSYFATKSCTGSPAKVGGLGKKLAHLQKLGG